MKKKPEYSPSHTESFLKGKSVPFSKSPIREVIKTGPKTRRIIFKDGTTRNLSKKELFSVFSASLSAAQAADAWATRTQHRNGKITMKIGGLLKGIEKSYANAEGAARALKRRYGVDPMAGQITRHPTASRLGRYQAQTDSLRGRSLAEQKPPTAPKANSARRSSNVARV